MPLDWNIMIANDNILKLSCCLLFISDLKDGPENETTHRENDKQIDDDNKDKSI